MKGLIHVYTGEGKGKTTAALGAALRAAGRGLRVVFVQFLKGGETGELRALKRQSNILVLRNSREYGFYTALDETERQAVRSENDANLARAAQMAAEGACDLLVLDECMAAYALEALDRAVLDALVAKKPEGLELILTGRGAPAHFIGAAQYVSEIKKVKHPFDCGVKARKGVEY